MLCLGGTMHAQTADSILTYRVEASGNVSNGTYAPLWLTSNRYGLSSVEPNSGYVRAGINFENIPYAKCPFSESHPLVPGIATYSAISPRT